jgi:hypothetical protein
VSLEREAQAFQLLAEIVRQHVGELLDRGLVDLAEAHPAGLVQGGLAQLVE